MIRFISDRFSDRKLRLFLVGMARLNWDKLPPGELRDAIETAEKHADGLASDQHIDTLRDRFYRFARTEATAEEREWLRPPKNVWFHSARMTTYPSRMLRTLSANSNWRVEVAPLHSSLAPVARCIFGNPFRPVTINSACLTPTVKALAEQIYNDRAFDRMPVLGDALEEAGCTVKEVLEHCRNGGEHVRGCWVVDMVLGKE
jgi:hypothetical protein